MASSFDTIKGVIALSVTGGYLIYKGLKRRNQIRMIEDTPCSDIGSAPQGLVEVQGHALPCQDGIVSLDGRPAVFRHFRVEKRVKRGKRSAWVPVFMRLEGVHFVVSDGTGLALVRTEETSDVVVEEKKRSWDDLAPEEHSRIHQTYGSTVSFLPAGRRGFFSFGPRYRVVEKFIAVGDPVYVRGVFASDKNLKPYSISPHHLRFLASLHQLRRQPGWKKKAYDLNRDGKIEEQEVDQASRKMLHLARSGIPAGERLEQVRVQGAFSHDPVHGLIIGRGHQEHVTARLNTYNFLRIVGGIAAIAAGASILFDLF